ncbi:Uncharacterised protein [Sphingobacterium thalpophilum]|uniref:Uncharacterized protein n=1 Tax=Sphingobacterium thalpophilum TaxID=259 RepID=A0A4U9V996_9SPHI|nr:Uncharacterised protein [Sphingobacterium thalpophilum]
MLLTFFNAITLKQFKHQKNEKNYCNFNNNH